MCLKSRYEVIADEEYWARGRAESDEIGSSRALVARTGDVPLEKFKLVDDMVSSWT